MSSSIKGTVAEVGHKIAETATKVGHKISEGVEVATDWAKEKLHHTGHQADEAAQKAEHQAKECGSSKSTADIRQHMDVIGSCGAKLGSVDHLEGGSIKLTRKDSPDGQHHYVPLSWVARVDEHVHLSKNCGEARQEWNVVPACSAG